MLRTDPSAPVIRLEKGSAVIEVGSSKEAPLLRVEVGDSVTELLERGVYEFDVEQGSLWVHAGQSRILRKKLSLTLQDGETTSLTSAEGTSKFDPGRKNSLLEWSASQSFELFAARAPFMTNWKETSVSHQATHKVFGSRNDSRVRTARSPAPSINTTITTVDGVSPH
jgi:hypothetical protein